MPEKARPERKSFFVAHSQAAANVTSGPGQPLFMDTHEESCQPTSSDENWRSTRGFGKGSNLGIPILEPSEITGDLAQKILNDASCHPLPPAKKQKKKDPEYKEDLKASIPKGLLATQEQNDDWIEDNVPVPETSWPPKDEDHVLSSGVEQSPIGGQSTRLEKFGRVHCLLLIKISLESS